MNRQKSTLEGRLRRMMRRTEKQLDRDRNPFGFNAVSSALAKVYGGAVCLRRDLYRAGGLRQFRLPAVTIAIGNITTGGTGKTPLTMWVAEYLQKAGFPVCILTRGYKGRYETNGGIVSDYDTIRATPAEAGDEPYLLAFRLPGVPVVAGKDRYAAGRRALSDFAPAVFVLDDGFQHLRLKRDLNLLVMDGTSPIHHDKLLPAGRLREPLSSLCDADAVVLRFDRFGNDRFGKHREAVRFLRRRFDGPVFPSRVKPYLYHVPAEHPGFLTRNIFFSLPAVLSGARTFAFSGIAQNWKFRYTLADFGLNLCGYAEFPDHHSYDARDIDAILARSEKANADLIATTEKDYIRFFQNKPIPADLLIVGIQFDFGRQHDAFSDLIYSTVAEKTKDLMI